MCLIFGSTLFNLSSSAACCTSTRRLPGAPPAKPVDHLAAMAAMAAMAISAGKEPLKRRGMALRLQGGNAPKKMKSNESLEPRMPQFRVLVGHHNLPSQHMIPSGISLERGSGFSYLNTPPYLRRCHKCSWAAVITRIPITDLKVRSSKKNCQFQVAVACCLC